MTDNAEDRFYIGIASSAGGLEALTQLVQHLPEDAGASYVVAQHMSPNHKSLIHALLDRETKLPVKELTESVVPEPNTVYVTPPKFDAVVQDGKFQLVQPSGRFATPSPSADRLFASLAEEKGERSMGIVLSGTGSDGSSGVQAIREVGGITIAQDPTSAKYDGMPSSAASTGCVDLILTPGEIGQHLSKILTRPYDLETFKEIHAASSKMADLMHILLARTRIDFRDYKENTVHRRVQRRMVALGIDEYDAYVDHCRSNVNEVDMLFKDLLISVTRFFRDPDPFSHLGEEISGIVEKIHDRPFRAWVAGCATGEEAYSIAILAAEALGGPSQLSKRSLQIFATDIDGLALDQARNGVYPLAAANDIPQDLVDKYFEFRGDHLHVKQSVKNTILFSNHNVFHDPPFSNIDLVSLRNLMIYFNPRLQERVLHRMHYALNRQGLLFLGSSEQLGSSQPDFEAVSSEHKIFRKRTISRTNRQTRMNSLFSEVLDPRQADRGVKDQDGSQRHLFDALARASGDKAMLLDADMNVLRVYGNFNNLVELSEETQLGPTISLLLRPLREEAPGLCSLALRKGSRRSGLSHVLDPDRGVHGVMEALPLLVRETNERYVLLTFQVEIKELVPHQQVEPDEDNDRQLMQQMQHEISSAREALQHTTEELQASNEELQSANEEMASTNEELQAANEELETSNEELQSTNEELITVNEELLVNSTELEEMTREQTSMLRYAPSLIIVVDSALQVRRASEEARARFKIPGQAAGRVHISQCFLPRGFPSLTELASEAIRLRKMQEQTFEIERVSVVIRCAPFYGEDDTLRGATIIVSELDRTAEYYAQQELSQKMQLVDDIGAIAHWRLSAKDGVLAWSDGMYRIHGLDSSGLTPSYEDAIEMFLPEDRPKLEQVITACLERARPFQYRGRIKTGTGKVVLIEAHGTPIVDSFGNTLHVVGVFRDLSTVIENDLLIEQFGLVQEELKIGFYSLDVANNREYWSDQMYQMLDIHPADQPNFSQLLDKMRPDDRENAEMLHKAAITEGKSYSFNAHMQIGRSKEQLFEYTGKVFVDLNGAVSYLFGTLRHATPVVDETRQETESEASSA
ncbi:chemotaxis protein CheB [Actibacterium sp. 188UL27-1]|uniref:chemotaxis protein CheB n=1 Tax=Actibacterium sp. 188UL27-1 TaxID=2786961 RepID=UPI00195D283A|nr:chemotaxis protein CheB [Actibacterium sp. 188UL27-1]MBM7066346.1 PAS domain-containing protein [Actibacterium sp. 188UL27-1]